MVIGSEYNNDKGRLTRKKSERPAIISRRTHTRRGYWGVIEMKEKKKKTSKYRRKGFFSRGCCDIIVHQTH